MGQDRDSLTGKGKGTKNKQTSKQTKNKLITSDTNASDALLSTSRSIPSL